MRVCNLSGCPELYPKLEGRYCRRHRAEHERRRGSRQARGYNANHDQLRRAWAPKVATGTVTCWRCKKLIARGAPWDLGHDDSDRDRYKGPEHANQCNRAAGGRAAHRGR